MSASPTIVDGTYEILGPLGAGGMGEVFEARHKVTGRHVALKLLRAENATKDDARRRFVREAQAIGRLDHPHVVEILDAGIDGASGAPFLVQTLLRGPSLRELVQVSPRMDPVLAVRLVAPVLRGLAAAHAAGIVHRDMKPTNVILSRRDGDAPGEVVPKIIDFGISKLHEQGDTPDPVSTITRSGVVVGTAAYMAPEQAEGRDDVDGRVDVWALGVMLYEMIVGRRPFEAPSTATLLLRIISHDPVPVAVARPEVPAAIGELVMRALQRDPAARWPTAAAMLAACEEALGTPLKGAAVTIDGLDELLASRSRAPAELPPAARAPTAETQPARPLPTATPGAVAPPETRAPSRWIAIGLALTLIVVALAAAATQGGGSSPDSALPPPPPPSTSVLALAPHEIDAAAAVLDVAMAVIDAGPAEPVATDTGVSDESAPTTGSRVRRRRDAGPSAPPIVSPPPPPPPSEPRSGTRGAPILSPE